MVGDVWANWGSDMAQWFASNAYPVTQISERTVRLTDEYIDRADPRPRCAGCSSRARTACAGRCAASKETGSRLTVSPL